MLRWDNTVRTTLGLRLAPQNPTLLAQINANDGDEAFKPGINSERLDALTEFDLSRGTLGVDFSADGWYDEIYHQPNANAAPASFNPTSVPHNQFPKAVRALQGADAEVLNANVHDSFDLGGRPVTVRIGRQTLLWGESLFSTENGIAAGQAPVDQIKAFAEPLAEARELFLPVTQAMADIALRSFLHAEFYVQGEWRRDRTPGVASYFSTSDIADVGGQRLFTPAGAYLRGPDRTPAGIDQFGAALRLDTGMLDLGLYALRYDAKTPQIYLVQSGRAGAAVPGYYGLLFPRGIDVLGASFSTYLGDSTLAGEVSFRDHMPLVSRGPASLAAAFGAAGAGGFYSGAPYAVGQSLHGQVSMVTILPPDRLWQGASLMAEAFGNDLLAVDQNAAQIAPGRSRVAASLHATFAPQYFQVLPQLDLSVPIGIGWNIAGTSSVLADQVAGTGQADIGLDLTWRVVWILGAAYTRFFGSPARQPLADRDFLALSISRTF